jgi:hypothetical protein
LDEEEVLIDAVKAGKERLFTCLMDQEEFQA